MSGGIDRRLATLETRKANRRRFVFYTDETIPPDHRGAYARMPRPCATIEEWLARCNAECRGIE
jgi:hypothetical protein